MTAPQQADPDTEPVPALSVWVPGVPVSTNRMYRQGRGGGRPYLTRAARAWEDAAEVHVYEPTAHPERWATPLRVRLTFSLVRAGDVDNYVKATLDGLKHGLGVDDRHFGTVEARLNGQPEYQHRYPDGKRVRATGCLIEVWPASAPEPEPEPSAEDDSSLVPVDRARVVTLAGGGIALVLPPEAAGKLPRYCPLSLEAARDLLTDLQRIPALARTTGAA